MRRVIIESCTLHSVADDVKAHVCVRVPFRKTENREDGKHSNQCESEEHETKQKTCRKTALNFHDRRSNYLNQ